MTRTRCPREGGRLENATLWLETGRILILDENLKWVHYEFENSKNLYFKTV
jgi:hypothetical protein